MTELTRADRLARIGYLARGIVYGLLGYLAIYGASQAHRGHEGEFEMIQDMPGGTAILLLLVVGLLAYGLYKLATAVLDLDRKGTKAKAVLERIGAAAGALAYLTMAWAALRFATGVQAQAKAGGNQETARTVLDLPLGELILALGGLGFLVAAAFQVHNAWSRHFMRAIEPDAPPFTCTAGRIGLAARSVVFALVGWSLLRAAVQSDEDQVRDLGGVLRELRDTEALYMVVAVGLIVFAVYSFIEARYRIVPRVDVVDAGKRQVEAATA